MEQVVRFCTSADGTRIAYATYGSGPPLVFANTCVLSMDAQFSGPEARSFFDALAARTTLVISDRRGCGASTRKVEDLSIEADAHDLAAVADAVGLESFSLFGDAGGGSAVCVRFAAAFPERAQRLILWSPSTSTTHGERDRERARSFREDWAYSRRIWAGLIYPDGPVSLQRACNRAIKESVSAELAARRFESMPDLRPALADVTQPALVIERDSGGGRQFAMRVASLLGRGQLRFVPGVSITPYPDHEPIVDATLEFLGIGETSGAATRPAASGTAIILFADIADSTALTERLGDAAFRERARELDAALRSAITEHHGTPIEGKLLGDGVLATFISAKDAIDAAQACAHCGGDASLPLHLGLHAGDVIREEGNVFGGAVTIASRISDIAAPGEVLVSQTVRDLARTSAGVSFEDRGEQELKGVSEAVRVYAVRSR